jgi:hypothetical protein
MRTKIQKKVEQDAKTHRHKKDPYHRFRANYY